MTRRDALKAALFGAVAMALGRLPVSDGFVPLVNPGAFKRTLARGGFVRSSGPYLVGELGPETLVMLSPGGWIVPSFLDPTLRAIKAESIDTWTAIRILERFKKP